MTVLADPPRSSRAHRLAGPVAAAAATAGAWVAVAVLDPGDSGPSLCPWRTITGLDCPFCGATRAAACLAHGQVVPALDHNALLVLVVLPLALVAWLGWTARAWRGDPPVGVGNRTIRILMIVTLAWWILRLAVPWLGSPAG